MNEKFAELIEKNLLKIENLDATQVERIMYALIDIEGSLNTIYTQILPKIADNNLQPDELQNLLWDIREEFRHIDYHIQDSELLG